LAWCKSPTSIVGNAGNGDDAWFSGSELSSSYLTPDYHVEQGRRDQSALIYD